MADLRAQFLKANPFRSRIVEVQVPQHEGEPLTLSVRVKQPTVQERNEIFAETKVKNGEISAGGGATTGAKAIIYCCRNPENDEPIFGLADLDALQHTPAGGWVDILASEVMKVLIEAQDNAKKSA